MIQISICCLSKRFFILDYCELTAMASNITSVSKREKVISLWSSGYRNKEINQAHELLKYSKAYLPTPYVLQLISPLAQQYPIL